MNRRANEAGVVEHGGFQVESRIPANGYFMADWDLAISGEPPFRIDPLR